MSADGGQWSDELARPPEELEEDEQPASHDINGLRAFIIEKVLPWFETRAKGIANRPLIQQQAFGEAFDHDKLERLGRYEIHLDRKFERTLSMLLKLKDLREPTRPDGSVSQNHTVQAAIEPTA